jgi:hypothetical protein
MPGLFAFRVTYVEGICQRKMRPRAIASLIVSGLLLLAQTSVAGFETDQYNLPPRPLADIGDEVTEHVEQKVRQAIDQINGEISTIEKCFSDNKRRKQNACESVEQERARLAFLRSSDAVARRVYQLLGAGVPPFTGGGTWVDLHQFHGHPARYRPSYFKSIFLPWPADALTVSPTVNMYGSQFGTDKIAHLFQQGYSYYKIYGRALAAEETPDEASQTAVQWGQETERRIFGTMISGVYSNGDLAANYAGLKFYLGLTQAFKIGAETRPAMVLLRNGSWSVNESVDRRELLLKPFISDHFNEALNPSIFTQLLGLRSFVRRSVKRRSCSQWFDQYPGLTQASLNERSQTLRSWHDEDYGFTESRYFITIANTCFADDRTVAD